VHGRCPNVTGITEAGLTEAELTEGEFTGGELTGAGFTESGFTEAELTELALAAGPGQPVGEDAVPIDEYLGRSGGLLPSWYMPAPMARTGGRWRLPVVLVIVGAFLVIEALGLCSTFGSLVPG
jgi:uncharacterized protein YjbI with pentapeptide repeats